MNYEAWQHKRGQLMVKEREERSANWQQSRAPIQAAITEQAVRELFDRVEALEKATTKSKEPDGGKRA